MSNGHGKTHLKPTHQYILQKSDYTVPAMIYKDIKFRKDIQK